MKQKIKKLVTVFLALLLFVAMTVMPIEAAEVAGEFTVISEVKEYGQVITKLVVKYDQTINQEDLSADLFDVNLVAKDETAEIYNGPIEITSVNVASNEYGESAESGNYVSINLNYGANVKGCSTLNFRFPEFHNHVMDLTYTVNQKSDFNGVNQGVLLQGKTLNLVVDDFDDKKSSSGLNYRVYSPASDDHKNPLIIWFHGAGEGGTNNVSQLAGNEGAVAFARDYQDIFDGAYVLAPQTPTFWVTDIDNSSGIELKAEKNYTDDVVALIKEYLASNDDIDTSRIYVGGCSKGGWQTISTLLAAPELFAAAFPICPAYTPAESLATDFSKLKDFPIWITHAKDDQTVTIDYSLTLVDCLTKAGADVTFTQYTDEYVMDDGSITNIMVDGVLYSNHFSWVPALNNLPVNDQGVHLVNWLAAQKQELETSPVQEVTSNLETAVKTDDVNNIDLTFAMLFMSITGGYLIINKKYN